MPNDMLPNFRKSGGPEDKFYRVANGSKIPDLGGKALAGIGGKRPVPDRKPGHVSDRKTNETGSQGVTRPTKLISKFRGGRVG